MTITINGSGSITGISAGGLPDAIITQPELAANVAGNGPAFVAVVDTATTCSASTQTKIVFGAEIYDTHSCYNPATSRFTPNVAGYYFFQGYCTFGSTTWGASGGASARLLASNGQGNYVEYAIPSNSNWQTIQASGLFYMNGTTDYIEFFVSPSVTTSSVQYGGYGKFLGHMVRAA